jgi:hypothetical protein
MRSVRLSRTFDVVQSFGSALLYALSNDDLERTLSTYAAHVHFGSLLLLDFRNALALLGDGFRPRIEGQVKSDLFSAEYVAEHQIDKAREVLVRRRTWRMPDGTTAEDFCEYRLILPKQIETWLREKGFKQLGVFDNKELLPGPLTGPTLYVVATFVGRGRSS